MTIVDFTPVSAAVGGALIGLAAALFIVVSGRVLGISGIFAGLLGRHGEDTGWQLALLLGLLVAPFAYDAAGGRLPTLEIAGSPVLLIVGGLLVGFGARLGAGCTSGHGVCGLARLSPRSFAAVATFLATAVLTVFVVRHVAGG